MRMAREGVPFVLLPLALAFLASSFGWIWVGGACFVAALKMAFFFRDPERHTPGDATHIYSPADGKVIAVEKVIPAGSAAPTKIAPQSDNPTLVENGASNEDARDEDRVPFPSTRVSIFLSLFNVHITRAPIAGVVESISARPGRYLPAYKDAAGEKNARVAVHLRGDGTTVLFRQVSGSLARRIKPYVRTGDTLHAGQRTGIIYFGSRVDLFLPESMEIKVLPGRRVRAGETVIAERPQ